MRPEEGSLQLRRLCFGNPPAPKKPLDDRPQAQSGTCGPPRQTTPPARRRWPLHTRILIGLVVGALLGAVANHYRDSIWPGGIASGTSSASDVDVPAGRPWLPDVLAVTDTIGKIFLRLVLMVVLPLVISALALGVLELGDLRRLGRVGVRTLVFTMVLSATSVIIGLGLVNLIKPGARLSNEQRAAMIEQYSGEVKSAEKKAAEAKSISTILLDIIPENPLQEMVGALDGSSKGNGMLAVMFFALMLGVALAMTPERTGPLVSVLEGVFDVSMTIIGFAMRLAPYCVACLVFGITARQGPDVLRTLVWFVITVLLGLSLQMFVVIRWPWRRLRDAIPGSSFVGSPMPR